MTEIRETAFSLDLPGEWEPEDGDQPGTFVYRDAGGDATVTVILLSVRPVYAIADRSRLHGDYVAHRMNYEAGQRRWLQQSEPVMEATDGGIEGAWVGLDVETNRRQLHRVVLAGDILGHFTYEDAAEDEAPFSDRAAAVLGSAAITYEPPGEGGA